MDELRRHCQVTEAFALAFLPLALVSFNTALSGIIVTNIQRQVICSIMAMSTTILNDISPTPIVAFPFTEYFFV